MSHRKGSGLGTNPGTGTHLGPWERITGSLMRYCAFPPQNSGPHFHTWLRRLQPCGVVSVPTFLNYSKWGAGI